MGELVSRAASPRRRLATLAVDTEIGFASAEDQAAFAQELTSTITRLAGKYHHDGGRGYRLVVVSHPMTEER